MRRSSLASGDRLAVSEIAASLRTVALDRPPALEQLKEPLYGLLRSPVFVYYSVRTTLEGVEIERIGGVSDLPRAEELGARFKRQSAPLWPAYDPIHVARPLRNRVTTLKRRASDTAWSAVDSSSRRILPAYGMPGFDQIRALVCDGPALLYWVGAMRRESYSARETTILGALLPHLQRRLRVERLVEGAPSLSLLAGVLDGFGRAAFLLGPQGRIEASNELGRRLWARERRDLSSWLAASRDDRQPAARFELTPIAAGEASPFSLAVERPRAPVMDGQVASAARRFSLTPRQGEVLALLVEGLTNRQIASELRCAERTVEVHVGAILERAQVDNRATLIAHVLTLES
jgi:DNA-binding CsgD family transcriptional regulator